eukprot:TRINITY_DN19808_c0_g1_i1.p1 TRINITY_DN19808_c0_g1~~TRINITY_DN19808_c0_g1_i1.p1  ORF type:complete len:276 (+),score=35.07 TRINITY_DN19808_c0_g1_i1:59-829(+)
MSIIIRPSASMSFRFLRKNFSMFHVPSLIIAEHPSLPEDEADDIKLYRYHKAAAGIPCVYLPTNSPGTLLDDEGDEKWSYEDENGQIRTVSAYDISLGTRSSDFFLKSSKVNTTQALNVLQMLWPEALAYAVVKQHIGAGPEIDPSLCIRDFYALGHKNLGTERELTDKGLVKASEVFYSRDDEDFKVPIYVHISDANEFGRGKHWNLGRLSLPSYPIVALFIFFAFWPIVKEMYVVMITPVQRISHRDAVEATAG